MEPRQMIAAGSQGGGSAWPILLTLAGVIGVTWWAVSGGASKAGWYTLLYNYPRGDRNRRLKGFAGPFQTKAEAEAEANREKDVWYPSVQHLKDSPQALGM